MIPGINLLGLASTLIATQGVTWIRFIGRTQNELGNWINEYAEPLTIQGSMQPVELRAYKELGLDLSKQYMTLFTSHSVDHVQRGEAPDVIEWNSRRYESIGGDPWYVQNGWKEVVLVDIGPAGAIL